MTKKKQLVGGAFSLQGMFSNLFYNFKGLFSNIFFYVNNTFITGTTSIFGAGDRDVFLIKYNSSGLQQWNTTWGGLNSEGLGGIIIENNSIYISGSTNSFNGGDFDVFLAKFDTNGTQLWNTT